MTGYLPQFPFHVVWNVTNRCNLRCEHCFSASGQALPGELTTAEGLDLIDQLADAGVFDLAFCGGEPLLRRDVFELMTHASRRGLNIGLGSNGFLITTKLLQRIMDAGVSRLQISLDGLQENHDAVRKLTGLFQRSLRAIRLIVESGLHTHVCFTPNRRNIADLEAVIDLCANLGVHLFNLSQFVPVGRGNQTLDLTVQEWHDVFHLWQRKRDEYTGRMAFASHLAQLALIEPQVTYQGAFRGCQAGTGQAAITADGYVFPCIVLPIPVGNLREQRFREIWMTSPLLQRLRARQGLEGLCGHCRFQSVCGGCRAVAWAYTGDCFAEDPRCWLVAAAQVTSRQPAEVNFNFCW